MSPLCIVSKRKIKNIKNSFKGGKRNVPCVLVPLAGILALLFALVMANLVRREEDGTDKMKEIASAIREGASAFLLSEYRVLIIFVAVLFFVLGFALHNWLEACCFLVGAAFSVLAGFFGMKVATLANVRTANAARTSGPVWQKPCP